MNLGNKTLTIPTRPLLLLIIFKHFSFVFDDWSITRAVIFINITWKRMNWFLYFDILSQVSTDIIKSIWSYCFLFKFHGNFTSKSCKKQTFDNIIFKQNIIYSWWICEIYCLSVCFCDINKSQGITRLSSLKKWLNK